MSVKSCLSTISQCQFFMSFLRFSGSSRFYRWSMHFHTSFFGHFPFTMSAHHWAKFHGIFQSCFGGKIRQVLGSGIGHSVVIGFEKSFRILISAFTCFYDWKKTIRSFMWVWVWWVLFLGKFLPFEVGLTFFDLQTKGKIGSGARLRGDVGGNGGA